jgi:Family of unknown function (DUF6516)
LKEQHAVNPFNSLPEYQAYIYSLPAQNPVIESSTLTVITRGAKVAITKGEVRFQQEFRLTVYEQLTTEDGPVVIEFYGYEIWHDDVKLYWYDAQPHPHIPELALNHPHHKHVPPDIKHNRIPAPGLSFTQPNLPFLIAEIEQLGR